MFKECVKKVNKIYFFRFIQLKLLILSFKIKFNIIIRKKIAACSMKFHLLIAASSFLF
jgi:hypothetical protein